MATRQTWIGKGIAVALGALAMASALPSKTDAESLSFLPRFVASGLLLSSVFGLYEFVGYVLGRAIARLISQTASQASSDEVPHTPARFGAGTAFLIFGAYLGTWLLAVTIIAVVAVSASDPSVLTSNNPRSSSWLAVMILVGTAAGGAASVALSLRYARDLIRVPGPTGIGLFRVGPAIVIRAAIIAALFGAAYILLAPFLATPNSKADFGPFVQLARAGGWPRFLGTFIAVLVAPPLEEFLFRGVLLAGIARTWNIQIAALAVTVLFVGLHLPYVARYWPAALALTLMALFLLALRLRSGSLLPGIAAHCAYNTIVSIAVYVARPS
jgi:membrane protease YdiL (CAAX protease family)